jgi:hypothetical protein
MVRVISFEILGPYRLKIAFDDATQHVIDFEPVLYGHYYGPLRNLDLFNQVSIGPDFHTLVWPNDADFDPVTLYEWHNGAGSELAQRMQALSDEPEVVAV